MRTLLLSLALAALLAGCAATVPKGSAILQRQAESMLVPDGYGAIYVFRPRLPPGSTLWGVNLDAQRFGYLAPGSYLYGFVRPGPHLLDLEDPRHRVHFEVNSGAKYFFRIVSGFPGLALQAIRQDEATVLLRDSTLSALNLFENDKARKVLRDQMPLD